MKPEFLSIEYFKIVPKNNIAAGATRQQIIESAVSLPEYPHISGSAKFITEEKTGNAGSYFVHQFVFSVASYLTDTELQALRGAGAVVLHTDLRTLVIHENDAFSNQPIHFTIKTNEDVTDVEVTRNALFLL